MATVTGYTAARMKEIEDKAITDGSIVSGNLILYPNDYPTQPSINAGAVIGPAGPTGPGIPTLATPAASWPTTGER